MSLKIQLLLVLSVSMSIFIVVGLVLQNQPAAIQGGTVEEQTTENFGGGSQESLLPADLEEQLKEAFIKDGGTAISIPASNDSKIRDLQIQALIDLFESRATKHTKEDP